ncbi:MAG TPA: Asp-tRNA(Asn)/Glu-tRNA(Gln) amidotransferase subunit GatB [Candidatus Moranbacteria bacterium]|nr:MAG: Aspartyl/glutamyl-tRNA(Asn/Gln) amidotransferase subunit C [Candidatus Moranbacteria bacterium GW2011_GWC2_45_10]KKT94800.1 MAG: glutamyl-tRNA(Gln) and/or aspartyl-tRNA(Asn) amidotransferase, C subunit, aspartyl-tRNA(Asn)/glutamyl-tRNA (Gln) amidotransferase subunit C [Parcubacteria group bacterium GW2011_GWC1_45_14]HAV11137.1 Asp-tRNA(Asn)/Glu-tRNA(Gln) amidotransferase subunit GatB [Candidatus Moranbacteria bacterium]
MLSRQEIQHIAGLARISLHEKEIEKYQKDLSGVLDYFAELQELDTEKVEPIGHITGMQNVFRSDLFSDFGSIGKDDILKNAPETKDGYVKVKSVL